MHTPQEAKELWCPMARVAQVGAVETHAAYNRSLSKDHVRVKVAQAAAENFQLGADPEISEAVMLKVETNISQASCCIADKCAMWRWDMTSKPKVNVTPNGLIFTTYEQVQTQTHGYCGLAPLAQAVAA